MVPPVEKVVRVSCNNGIPLPNYVGDLLFYFKNWIRSSLNPTAINECYWVNTKGRPLGKCFIDKQQDLPWTDDASFSSRVVRFVQTVFGEEYHITPITFRRVMPSLVWRHNIKPKDMSMADFLRDYAALICTSDKVLLQHYIRIEADANSSSVVQNIEQSLLMTPAGKISCLTLF